MDVNNIVSNVNGINAYSGDSNTSQYGSSATETGINSVTYVSNEAKAALSSENFEKSKDGSQYTQKELDDALNKVNNFLKDEKTHAEYSRHKDFGTLMIKIVDDKTKEVILELPPEKILDMVASMCRQVGLLDKKA